MARNEYKGLEIVFYDCGEKKQKTSCLKQMGASDQSFEKSLKTNDRLRNILETTTSPGCTPHQKSVLDATEPIAILYIEHSLLNRARFACSQKYHLYLSYNDIPSGKIQCDVERRVDSELLYVSSLLERFESSPEILEAKALVSGWLMRDFHSMAEEEGEMGVGAQDEDNMMIDRKHVIPLEYN
jgi:hypothetical protein